VIGRGVHTGMDRLRDAITGAPRLTHDVRRTKNDFFAVVAKALGMDMRRILPVSGDSNERAREPLDDGNSFVAIKHGVDLAYGRNLHQLAAA